ncbi:hypothetical protein F5144DRAFT_234506 [Chaetomium tenue]|uniref:Uncharacterized protein n=1 Tax=Chaetomium tenue TaxID=1854479 RepID=A0ACB7P8W4_9PEZI|nr:hypothetical protein F5144DRAFT_234506 [Chaetomium globosum]
MHLGGEGRCETGSDAVDRIASHRIASCQAKKRTRAKSIDPALCPPPFHLPSPSPSCISFPRPITSHPIIRAHRPSPSLSACEFRFGGCWSGSAGEPNGRQPWAWVWAAGGREREVGEDLSLGVCAVLCVSEGRGHGHGQLMVSEQGQQNAHAMSVMPWGFGAVMFVRGLGDAVQGLESGREDGIIFSSWFVRSRPPSSGPSLNARIQIRGISS